MGYSCRQGGIDGYIAVQFNARPDRFFSVRRLEVLQGGLTAVAAFNAHRCAARLRLKRQKRCSGKDFSCSFGTRATEVSRKNQPDSQQRCREQYCSFNESADLFCRHFFRRWRDHARSLRRGGRCGLYTGINPLEHFGRCLVAVVRIFLKHLQNDLVQPFWNLFEETLRNFDRVIHDGIEDCSFISEVKRSFAHEHLIEEYAHSP